MIVLRLEPPALIQWQCSVCDDDGVISNWENSPHDLRRRRLTLAGTPREIVLPAAVATTLRELQLLDANSERLVFRMRGHRDGAALIVTADELDELIGSVAAEANHEPNRGRQQRLNAAFDTLNDADSRENG